MPVGRLSGSSVRVRHETMLPGRAGLLRAPTGADHPARVTDMAGGSEVSAAAIRRAAADRVVYDCAALLTVVAIAEAEGAVDAVCPGTGQTIRQVIEEIARAYAQGAGQAAPSAESSPGAILRAGRDALLATLTAKDASREEAEQAALDAAWQGIDRGLDVLEALPALAEDQVLVTWAALHDWSRDVSRSARARAILIAVEKRKRQKQRRRLARR